MNLRPHIPRLDTAPLKDVARSLRFVAERGGRTLQKSLPLDALPDPAARVADAAIATVLKVGQEAERGVSAFAHALLDRDEPPPPLDHPEEEATESRFAAAAHDGLRDALARLGAESSLVSEMAARRAWRAVQQDGPARKDSETAAVLLLALDRVTVVREAVWQSGTTPAPDEAARTATFAVLLAMLADPAGYRALLPAVVDIALALRADIVAAGDDPASLAALFDEFRDHV